MKYTEAVVAFREFPDEIALCINISNCPNHCVGCHTPKLREDIGTILDSRSLQQLIEENWGITCVGFMGGDANVEELNELAKYIKDHYNLKVGWYSGQDFIDPKLNTLLFDYIKIGHYDANCGPLDNPNTNQRMYKNIEIIGHTITGHALEDITYKFYENQN